MNRRALLAAGVVTPWLAACAGRAAAFAAATDTTTEVTVNFAINLESWFMHEEQPANFRGWAQRVERSHALGFRAVEIWPYQNKHVPQLAALLRSLDMTLTQFTAWGFGQELNHPEVAADSFVAAIEESCAVAAELPGCDLFTVVVGDVIDGLSTQQMHAAAARKLERVVPLLERFDKTIIIEPMNPFNHPGHSLYGSRAGIALCQAVGSPRVRLNWDLFHMQRAEGNLIANLQAGADYVGYLQIADSPGRHQPGTGEVNYAEVLRHLPAIEYTRPIGLELFPQHGDIETAARAVWTLQAELLAITPVTSKS